MFGRNHISVSRVIAILVASTCLMGPVSPSDAVVTGIANGDASVVGAGFSSFPGINHMGSPWFQSVAAGNSFEDWIFTPAHSQYSQLDSNANGNVFGFSNASGFMYQEIGTYVNEGPATLTGVSVSRLANPLGGATFSLFQTPVSTTGANGTPMASLVGASLLDSAVLPVSSPGAFSLNLDLSGATPGNKIWFSVSNVFNNGETFLDDLVLTVASPPGTPSIPEPATVALGMMGIAMLVVRRTRKA